MFKDVPVRMIMHDMTDVLFRTHQMQSLTGQHIANTMVAIAEKVESSLNLVGGRGHSNFSQEALEILIM